MVDVYDIQMGVEEAEDGFNRGDGNGVLDVFEIGEQQDVLCRLRVCIGGNDDGGGYGAFYYIQRVAAHEHLAEAGSAGDAHDDQLYIIPFYIILEGVDETVILF